MLYGNAQACDIVGFPVSHGTIFGDVATQLDCVILSRAVGKACTMLIEEKYGLKGFRIDTKSCSWGPMMGFVCVDPRLNKEGMQRAKFNTEMTQHALSGHIPEHLGDAMPGQELDWKADVVPIAISQARLNALLGGIDGKVLRPTTRADGFMRGVSEHAGVKFPWALIKLPPGTDPKYGTVEGDVWGVFVDNNKGFKQQYPYKTISSVWREHGGAQYQALLGLANPGTGKYGYKACVTGDYDLFGVWPHSKDLQSGRVAGGVTAEEIKLKALFPHRDLQKFATKPDMDVRRLAEGKKEHFQLGNITRRINLVKVMLNTRLQDGKLSTGQAVHHSDEAGNPNQQLQKSLNDSMPVIAFVPSKVRQAPIALSQVARRLQQDRAIGIENIDDMKVFIRAARELGFIADLRADWKPQLGVR